ncbi:MAG: hypothetical protein F6K39_35075 [Okeania sp. SIO3B3]|nr:hypothetical protein [Okeania sp. SIO3B3]
MTRCPHYSGDCYTWANRYSSDRLLDSRVSKYRAISNLYQFSSFLTPVGANGHSPLQLQHQLTFAHST